MAYDKPLADRIEKIVGAWPSVTRRFMFGGVCHLVNGNMFAGVLKEALILRLGETGAAEALAGTHAKPFDITGRPMKGWVIVGPAGVRGGAELEAWLSEAYEFSEKLPAKIPASPEDPSSSAKRPRRKP